MYIYIYIYIYRVIHNMLVIGWGARRRHVQLRRKPRQRLLAHGSCRHRLDLYIHVYIYIYIMYVCMYIYIYIYLFLFDPLTLTLSSIL